MDKLTNMIIGSRIAQARASKTDPVTGKKLSQKRLGEMLDVAEQTIIRWEKGQTTNIGSDFLTKISEILEVSVDWLLGLSNVPSLDPDFQQACKSFGISEKIALKILKHRQVITSLLSSDFPEKYEKEFAVNIHNYFSCLDLYEGENDIEEFHPGKNQLVIDLGRGLNYFAQAASNNLFSALNALSDERRKQTDGES